MYINLKFCIVIFLLMFVSRSLSLYILQCFTYNSTIFDFIFAFVLLIRYSFDLLFFLLVVYLVDLELNFFSCLLLIIVVIVGIKKSL
jgi:hypothetical protein